MTSGYVNGGDKFVVPCRLAFVGGYAPRRCGNATFTHDLCEAAPSAQCIAGAVNDRAEGYKYSLRVRFEVRQNDLDSYRRAADSLNFNNTEVLCMQHELSIYGGPAGSHILALLNDVRTAAATDCITTGAMPTKARSRPLLSTYH